MPKAPASINVLVYLTDGEAEYLDNLKTIKVDNLEWSSPATLTAPYDLLQSLKEELLEDLESAKLWEAGDAMVYRDDSPQLQPKFTLQPDTGTLLVQVQYSLEGPRCPRQHPISCILHDILRPSAQNKLLCESRSEGRGVPAQAFEHGR